MKEQVPKQKIDLELAKKVHRVLFSNKYRGVIFALVINPDNKDWLTISNIHKGLCEFYGEKTDYKNTYKHIKILEKEGFIKIKPVKHTQGNHSIISLKDRRVPKIFNKIMEIISPEIINYKLTEEEKIINNEELKREQELGIFEGVEK